MNSVSSPGLQQR